MIDEDQRVACSGVKYTTPAKADVYRLYLPRAKGGRGLTQVELTYKTTTISLAAYLKSTNDPLLHLVQQHENEKKFYSIPKEAAKFMKGGSKSQRTACQLKVVKQWYQYAKKIKTASKHGLKHMARKACGRPATVTLVYEKFITNFRSSIKKIVSFKLSVVLKFMIKL